MTLKELQVVFSKLLPKLLDKISETGYECTLGEAYRTPVQAWINSLPANSILIAKSPNMRETRYPEPVGGVGSSKSVHMIRLAIDLNLFKDGMYLADSKYYQEFGEYWKGLHPLCRWGGDFKDGNHFSMEFEGRK